MAKYNNIALGYLRAFVVVLVLAHHSVIAYSVFARFNSQHFLWGEPLVDTQRWFGFDLLVLYNDLFFMPLMFFLSGLFVWPSLMHKGKRAFVRDRVLRLGLPFAVGVLFLMPLAYYPSFRMTGTDIGIFSFWQQCFSVRNWPGGPMWFIWVLLVFDLIAARVHAVFPELGEILSRRATRIFNSPAAFFAILVALSAIVYLPMLRAFGPTHWFTFGPFSVWTSRLLLYVVYFSAGLCVGAYGVERGFLARNGSLARNWVRWLFVGIASYALVVALHAVYSRMGSNPISLAMRAAYGLAFVFSCGAIGFGMLALFLRFVNDRSGLFDNLHDNTYGMYLIHYIFVIWLQYILLDAPLYSTVKAALVFTGALIVSWSITATARRTPAVGRIV